MVNHKRRKRLLKLLAEHTTASVPQLVEWLCASPATVRRDISWLAAQPPDAYQGRRSQPAAEEARLPAHERNLPEQHPVPCGAQARHCALCRQHVRRR